MGFGLLFFFFRKKKGTNKKPNFVLKVPFQYKPLSQPKVPPQHHSATHLCISSFKAASPTKHSSYTSTGRNQTLNPRLLQMMRPSLPRRNPDLCT